MTKEQRAAIAVAQRLAKSLEHRPTGKDLWREGIGLGQRHAFRNIHALLEAAGLALPCPRGRPGLTPREETVFLRLWEAGASRREIGKALGLGVQEVSLEVAARGITRQLGPRTERGETAVLRRCQNEWCGQLTQGSGPCSHCGAGGLSAA